MKVIKYIFISSSGSGNVINYGSGPGSEFLTSYYGSGSGSTSQKVTVPTVPVPQRCLYDRSSPRPDIRFSRPNIRASMPEVELSYGTDTRQSTWIEPEIVSSAGLSLCSCSKCPSKAAMTCGRWPQSSSAGVLVRMEGTRSWEWLRVDQRPGSEKLCSRL